MQHIEIFKLKDVGRKKRRAKKDDYRWILRGIDLTIYAGERLALIGPSGSGKTTLLRSIADLEPIDEGEILFKDKPLQTIDPHEYRRGIGFVQQTPALFDGSVAENIRYGPRIFGEELPDDRVVEILRRVGLSDESLADARSDALSIGQMQRVAIARSLSMEPKILLMDEPTSALDSNSANRIIGLVAGLAKEMELTAVIVLHDLAQARGGSDRIALLVDGGIDSVAGTEDFFENPPTETAKRFLKHEDIGEQYG